MASPDEAAALKRNVVHQTRLKLALKQLDRDKSVKMREMNKDSQVFLRRLEQMNDVRRRASLPSIRDSMPHRIASAPARVRKGTSRQESEVGNANDLQEDHSFVTKPAALLRRESKLRSNLPGCSKSKSPLTLHSRASSPPLFPTARDEQVSPREKMTSPRVVRFNTSCSPSVEDETKEEYEHCRTVSPIVAHGTSLMKIITGGSLARRHTAPPYKN